MINSKRVLDLLAYGIALIGFVPLFPYLDPLSRLFFPAALVFGFLADRKTFRTAAWISTATSLIFFAYYGVSVSRDNLVGPVVNLLVILLSVRLFSEKTARNYLQIFAISLLAFAGSSLFTVSPLFLVYLFLMLLLIAVSLVLLTYYSNSSDPYVSRRGLKKILSTALIMPIASLPLLLVFFFILPRTQFPLWNFLAVSGAAVTGMSDTVVPGSSPVVGEAKNVAFRANCERLPKEQTYWRGIVLNAIENNAWVRRPIPPGEEGGVTKGRTIRQTIYPEPGRTSYLVALNIPRGISGIRSSGDRDFTFTARGGGSGRIKYDAQSVLSDTIVANRGIDRRFYLTVPERQPGRLVDLGESIARRGKSDEEKLTLLESEFLSARLAYATTGLPVGASALESFLFEKKRGHCELFASSFALLLRLAGVPSRLVGGYLGGEYNDLGGYYVVTDSMAHVWVEAYIQGKGWVTIDPSRLAADFPGAREPGKRSLASRLGMALDAFSYYWNVSVINYDLERQFRLIRDSGIAVKALNLKRLAVLTLYCGGVLLTVLAAGYAVKRWRTGTAEEKLLKRFTKKIAREYGIMIVPETGLHDLSGKLADPLVTRFVALYGSAVYHDRRLGPDELRELDSILRDIKGSGRRLAGAASETSGKTS